MTNKVRRLLAALWDDFIPHSEALVLMENLPALPEADRMRTKPAVTRKPRTIQEWQQTHGRRTA